MPFIVSRRRRSILAAVIAAGALNAAPAQAAATVANPGGCFPQPTAEQPFAALGDLNTYTLVPGGNFEGSVADWTLSRGAQVVAGNDALPVGSPDDRFVLDLPARSSAVTAPICIDDTHHSLRLLARNTGRLPARLKVEVVYRDTKGRIVTRASGAHVAAPGAWAATAALPIDVEFDPTANGAGPVAFRISAPASSWQIDDVYVDPRARG